MAMPPDPWSDPGTVAGFASSPPNEVLMRWAGQELARRDGSGLAVDLGCGAGRNAIPLIEMGWNVVGTDLSWPMLEAAAARTPAVSSAGRLDVCLADMERLPLTDGRADLIIAHGIWNLARTGSQLRAAVQEAARVAKPDAALFVFTFSRHTLDDSAQPVPGETFVFTQFSGRPQCFLTSDQLMDELAAAGFHPDPAVPLTEYNRPTSPAMRTGGPVIYECGFRARHALAA